MQPLEGDTKASEGQVCKLIRSLYGLKQAGRQWNKELTGKLQAFGFLQSAFDHCLFTKGSGSTFISLIVYVDDQLIAKADEAHIKEVKEFLDEQLTIKDLGYAKYFLGLEIARSEKGMLLNQRKYIMDIIKDMGLQNAKSSPYPMLKGLKLDNEKGELLRNQTSIGGLQADCYTWDLPGQIFHT